MIRKDIAEFDDSVEKQFKQLKSVTSLSKEKTIVNALNTYECKCRFCCALRDNMGRKAYRKSFHNCWTKNHFARCTMSKSVKTEESTRMIGPFACQTDYNSITSK